jgi:hypothetical protein
MSTEEARLAAELRYAKKIIGAYELEIRLLPDYLQRNPTGQGFCQGSIVREWKQDMAYWGERAAREAEGLPEGPLTVTYTFEDLASKL